MLNSTFAVFLVFVATIATIRCEIETPFFKRTDCGNLCTHVRCAPQKEEDCHASQVFVPRDGDCYCCDTCSNRAEVPEGIDKKCKPDHCALIDCRPMIAKECFDKGMAFAPRDNDCSCCDTCVSL